MGLSKVTVKIRNSWNKSDLHHGMMATIHLCLGVPGMYKFHTVMNILDRILRTYWSWHQVTGYFRCPTGPTLMIGTCQLSDLLYRVNQPVDSSTVWNNLSVEWLTVQGGVFPCPWMHKIKKITCQQKIYESLTAEIWKFCKKLAKRRKCEKLFQKSFSPIN